MQANKRSCSLKFGFLGSTGVGKNTCAALVQKNLSHLSCAYLSLAEPLYDVQSYLYRVCGQEKKKEVQDGVLLNFLGQHMRRINPRVLLDSFARRLKAIESEIELILCCDVRPSEALELQKWGFQIIHVAADPKLTQERRLLRGDLSLSDSNHPTEKGLTPDMYHYHIENNGTFQELEEAIMSLLYPLDNRDFNWV